MVQESNIGDKMPEIDTDVCTETEKNEPLLTVILDTSRGSGLKYENICRIILQKHFNSLSQLIFLARKFKLFTVWKMQ